MFSLCVGEFRNLTDVNFVCAMGPPGGGRNPITPRIMRHFNYLAFTELEDTSKAKIFSTIVNWWLRKFVVVIITSPAVLKHLQTNCTFLSFFSFSPFLGYAVLKSHTHFHPVYCIFATVIVCNFLRSLMALTVNK